MKIGLTSIVFNKQGGISRYVVELASRLVKEHEVHLLTSRYEHKIEGLKVHENNIIWKPISLQVASNALANARIIRELRNNRIDVINSQGAEAINSDVVTMQSCHKAAIRMFNKDRGPAYSMLKFFEPRSNIVLAIEKRALNNCKKIIAISHSVKNDLMSSYGLPDEKIEVIYSGVNLEEFNPRNKAVYREEIRRKHGIDINDVVLMFSGWEFRRKGLRYAIESLTGLGKDVKLLVVGGADKREYETLARRLGVGERVVFAGHQKEISGYYAASDVFVFPTAYEPFGLVITEAMASGLPVVTTKNAGAAELITSGVDGMLLDSPYDGKEVAEKVRYVLDDSVLHSMSVKAMATAEKYSWDKVVKETLGVYEKTIMR